MRQQTAWFWRMAISTTAALLATNGSLLAADAPDAPDARTGAWIERVQATIAASEYHVAPDDRFPADRSASWSAPNRAQDLRTRFTNRGIRVTQRTGTGPSWEWSLALVGHGRGSTVAAVGDPVVDVRDNRIEFDRGAIEEWYLNSPRGLEQGFTLNAPPAPVDSRNTPAFLILELGGDLSPIVSADGQAVDFELPGEGHRLRYDGLHVFDATGVALPAWLEVSPARRDAGRAQERGREIRILFDDDPAVYPVTIDPLVSNPSWSVGSNQASAQFGYDVSTAGDVNGDGYSDVIVGAMLFDNGESNEGRVFVYHGSASGPSVVPAWFAESDQAGARLGISVSTAGDVNGDGYADVIAGAYRYSDGENGEGRAYVFHGSATGLGAAPAWTAESNQAEAEFGFAVSTAGDVNADGYVDVIVGARNFDNGEANEGRAFVYLGSASGLQAAPAWTVEGNQVGASLGRAVSTAGDVNGDGFADVVVGVARYDDAFVDEGRADVYHGSAAGLSTTPDWTTTSGQFDAWFGVSVATVGDVNGDGYADVAVGAHRHYVEGLPQAGRVFVYHGSAAGLGSDAAWTAEGDQQDARFGVSVSTAGDVNGDGYADLVVGSYLYDAGQENEGRAYVYHGSPVGLRDTPAWRTESNQAGAYLGYSVSTAGDVDGDGFADLLVGALYFDAIQADEGRVFLFRGGSAGLTDTDAWVFVATVERAEVGHSVADAGDVDGDGYADIIVGAPYAGYDHPREGRAYVFHGSPTGDLTEIWRDGSGQTNAYFGDDVAGAGDIDGDGYSDIVVCAPGWDNGEEDEGKVFVYRGSPTGIVPGPAWTVEGNLDEARISVAGAAGDVDGDGYDDLIVASPGYAGVGRVWVYPGSAQGLSTTASWFADGPGAGGRFGHAVATAGDVNGDGYADIIVSRPFDTPSFGTVFAYYGSPFGLYGPTWTAAPATTFALFGVSVASAGDVDGDGYDDVLIGAPAESAGQEAEGRVYLYRGGPGGLGPVADWIYESNVPGTYLGYHVAGAGDVNGDGYADTIVGTDAIQPGAVVHHGSASGLAALPAWTAGGADDEPNAVAAAGDVNGDGYGDVVIGVPGWDNQEIDTGRVTVHFGGEGRGVALRPEQRLADGSAQITAGGVVPLGDGFRLAAIGRTPFGRARVRLEWEIKPFGQPFDGSGTQLTDWMDTGTDGATFDEWIAAVPLGRQHWRVRLHYDPRTTLYQDRSRWFTIPRGGWEQADLRVRDPDPAVGSVPDGNDVAGEPLTVSLDDQGDVVLNWSESCDGTSTDYAVYVGQVGDFDSHTIRMCSTGGVTEFAYPPDPVDEYYLVVPVNLEAGREGGYGYSSDGTPRPAGVERCYPAGEPAVCPAEF